MEKDECGKDFEIVDGVLVKYLGKSKYVLIPASVKKIDEAAFMGCKSLERVVIPNSVRKIKDKAFEDCENLASVVIPESVKYIGHLAFKNCKSLKSVEIPDTVKQIGLSAFAGCHIQNLNHAELLIKNGLALSNDETVLLYCADASMTSVVIPDSVKEIRENAFCYCENLESVVIPGSVKEIGDWAFYGCKSLKSVVIPESVEKIGWDAFNGCHIQNLHHTELLIKNGLALTSDETVLLYCADVSMTSVVIPDSVESIGDYAFGNCENIRSVVIPDSVEEIGKDAFKDCHIQNLNHAELLIKGGLALSNDETVLLYCADTSMTNAVIPDTVKYIGEEAFYGYESLESVVIPDSVKKIGDYAFGGCESLKSVVIPDSVKKIGYHAFSGCKRLESIVIPDSVEKIGVFAFAGCNNLDSATKEELRDFMGYGEV